MTIPDKNITPTTSVKSSQDNLATSDEKASVFKWFGRKIKTYSAQAYMFFHCLIFYRSLPKNINIRKIDTMSGVTKKIFNCAYDDMLKSRIENFDYKKITRSDFKKLSAAFEPQIKLKLNNKSQKQTASIVEPDKIVAPVTMNMEVVSSIFSHNVSDAAFREFLTVVNELIKSGKLDRDYFIDILKHSKSHYNWGRSRLIGDLYFSNAGFQRSKVRCVFNFIKVLGLSGSDKIDIILSDFDLALMLKVGRGDKSDTLNKVDYVISLVTETLYNDIEDEESKKYLMKKISVNLLDAVSNGPSVNEELITRLLNLIANKNICDQDTKEECIKKMVKNYTYFLPVSCNEGTYAKNFSNAILSAKNLTKEEKLDILSKFSDYLDEGKKSLLGNDSGTKIRLETLLKSQTVVKEAIDKVDSLQK